jgi:integrase
MEFQMKTIDPNQIQLALLPKGTPTFATLIEKLEADRGLSDLRRRDLISGLRRVSKALGRPPEETIADPKWLQPRLSQIAPAALGLTQKSWQNAVSDARAALAHIGIVKPRTRRNKDLQADWQILWQKVRALGDHNLTARLGRFLHFLSNLGIAPDEVTQAHADAFLQAIQAEEIAKRPEVSWRGAVNAWNSAASRIDGWPQLRLVLPKRANLIKRPDEELPPAFLADLDAQMQRMKQPDPFAEDAPMRALAVSTIKQRTRMLKRFASELLAAGVPETEIGSVASLCAPDLAKRGLQAMVTRNGNKSGVVIDNMARILLSCAHRLGLDTAVRAGLADLARRVALPPQKGMTRKNRDRLRVLRDDATLRRLLELPDKLCAAGHKLRPEAAALAREDALAIAILLVCPLRIGNIAGIRIDCHVQRPGDGRVFLVFAEEEVKNDRPMEFELPRDVRQMLDKHLAHRSPLLCPAGTSWLFPRRDGTGPVAPSTLSTRLKQRIHKETGIVMNAHLFRSLAGMLYLEDKPGSYEAVRRLLGHSSTSNTIRLYTGLETGAVFETFRNVLTAKKGGK